MTNVHPEFIIEENNGEGGLCLLFPENNLWIHGLVAEDGFNLYEMHYGTNSDHFRKKHAKKGFGSKALLVLKKTYGDIYACEVTRKAEPFWLKMVERGIVKQIVSYWD
jgi:hypothetical protein